VQREPVVISREDLAEEFRKWGWTEEQIAMHPGLRAAEYYFYPSIPAWVGKLEEP
jgi:hypothetical protein